jgi:hypothetical protein
MKKKNIIFICCICSFLLILGYSVYKAKVNSERRMEVAVGNKLYIPEGYNNKLNEMGFVEVVPMPYFHEPFITVAKDVNENQYAIIFRENGNVEKEKLPVHYEDIANKLIVKGCDLTSFPEAKNNLHLFEINQKLFWNFEDGNSKIFLDAYGNEDDPFSR